MKFLPQLADPWIPKHAVNDNTFGRVELDDTERELTRTATFQRLARIQQLGLAALVYPGANHTRYSHAIGVMHVVGKAARGLGLAEDEYRLLRLAGLLHDIG